MANPVANDPFFSLERDSEWNACIGKQGHAENYVDGYMAAALALVSAVIDQRNLGARDTLAMPILYNGRHALELSLKFAVDQLHGVGVLAETAQTNHDIKLHWNALVAGNIGDAELRRILADLAPYMESLHAIDEDGQQLRYAKTREGDQSLADKAICNLELVRESLRAMGALLGRLKHRVLDYVGERGTGSFIPECSRSDLLTIAQMLPPYAKWTTEEFTAAKQNVMETFGLGSGKFSDALDIIKANPEMGAPLGFSFSLKHLSDEHARFALAEWDKAHPPRAPAPDGIVMASDISLAEIRDGHEKLDAAVEAIMNALPLEAAAELDALFYTGTIGGFPETHATRLGFTIDKYRKGDHRDSVRHIMGKANLGDAVQRASITLGRGAFAGEVGAILTGRAETAEALRESGQAPATQPGGQPASGES